ncbi:MAG: rhodanese-like domain-containing protein [Chloroflexi bacterium]|nr:rhodanese-like domain-containing protein [Chloroflexota bacterium]
MSSLFDYQNAAHKDITIVEYRSDFLDTNTDHALIDVRTPFEFARGHLPGAINIPLNQLQFQADKVPTDKPVVFVCATGTRSADAAYAFANAGFDNVYNLAGGTMMWMMNGLPLDH